MKSGFCAVLGRPNAGKSTLVNALVGKRVSIVSPKAQTTRDDIMGIYRGRGVEIAFIDTPGLFEGSETLYRRMNRQARRSLSGVDAVLFLVDASNGEIGKSLATLGEIKVDVPVFVVLTKIDLLRAPEAEKAKSEIRARFPDYPLIEISALTNFGLADVIEAVGEVIPEGPSMFPSDAVSDRDEAFEAKESIRSYLLRYLHQEVPHEAAVLVTSFEKKEREYRLSAVIYVEKASQKAIVIGKGGAMIKKISMSSRLDLEKRWKGRVELNIRVEVLKDWRHDPRLLTRLGYGGKD